MEMNVIHYIVLERHHAVANDDKMDRKRQWLQYINQWLYKEN